MWAECASRVFTLTKELVMLKEFIAKKVASKEFCTWAEACQAAGLGKYLPTQTTKITTAFRSAVPGSDAIIVNSYGLYGRPELPEQHHPFLKANGYSVLPGFIQKVRKERSKKEVSAEAGDLAKEVAELKAMLAQLVAKAA